MEQLYCSTILQDQLSKRKERNKFYSLRAFARDLGIGSTTLSDVLAQKRQLSKSNIIKISEKLSLSPLEIERLNLERLGKKQSQTKQEIQRIQLIEKEFKLIAEWYYLAILNLAQLKNNKSNSLWISKRLGITKEEAKLALTTLHEMNFIVTKKGVMCRTAFPLSTTHDIPSRAIRKYHREVLYKAIDILDNEKVDTLDREFSSTTMLINPNQLEKAKKVLNETKYKVEKILESGERTSVYNFTYQVFPLDNI